jgi:hypothetical protein
MPYRIAGIDVHKKMLAVVVADVEVEGARELPLSECGFFGVRPEYRMASRERLSTDNIPPST